MTAIYLDGKPHNLEAAANDALTWLEFLANRESSPVFRHLGHANLHKLYECILLLQRFVPTDAKFIDTPKPTIAPFPATEIEVSV